jgi:hAT family C-terminal dimerisation region
LILGELHDDEDTGKKIVENIRLSLHYRYPPGPPPTTHSLPLAAFPSTDRESTTSTIGSRLFQKLHPQDQFQISDVDKYFDSHLEYASVADVEDPKWLCKWWYRHSRDYPQMAAAARDYLAIPGSGVAVERLFNKGRDVLGIRRQSMKSDTLRMLMLLDGEFCGVGEL